MIESQPKITGGRQNLSGPFVRIHLPMCLTNGDMVGRSVSEDEDIVAREGMEMRTKD